MLLTGGYTWCYTRDHNCKKNLLFFLYQLFMINSSTDSGQCWNAH